jgi:hypothetical protein
MTLPTSMARRRGSWAGCGRRLSVVSGQSTAVRSGIGETAAIIFEVSFDADVEATLG